MTFKVDLEAVDQKRFHLNARTIPGLGDFVLLVPHKAMWDWDETDIHMRSLLCRPDGTVVSCGFPKFFNLGENAASDAMFLRGHGQGDVRFRLKADGSLIIRSVIDGKVHFRTRGCEQVAEQMHDDVQRLVRDEHPDLLRVSSYDEERGLGASTLFEYVAPQNQIVVRYDRPKLYALGWTQPVEVDGTPRVFVYPGTTLAVPEVEDVILPSDVDELKAVVGAYEGKEGVVAWTRVNTRDFRGYHLCKLKSSWYMRLHALRTEATSRYLREFCYLNSIRSLEDLRHAMLDRGFDWEVCQYMQPMYEELQQQREVVDARLLLVDADMIRENLRGLGSRKDKALMARALADRHGSDLFGYVMKRALCEDDDAAAIADGLRIGMSLTQLKQFRKANGLL